MRRRGRALMPHPSPRPDGAGRILVSRQLLATQLDLHIDMVRRTVPAVACDVATRAWLVDLDEAEQRLTQKSRRTVVAGHSQ